MDVLVDTSVWVDYFKGGSQSADMDALINNNLIVTNDLILAELVPFLKIKRQQKVIRLLYDVRRLPLDIDWENIIACQTSCLKKGANGIGIPDLIIAQSAKSNGALIYSLDKHFKLLKTIFKVDLYNVITEK